MTESENAGRIVIYTDGACANNPGDGGWGAVILTENEDDSRELFGGVPDTTNNRMEMRAVIEALKAVPPESDIMLNVDSKYVLDGMTSWIKKWKQNDWQTRDGDPVKNQELWMELDSLTQGHTIEWNWIKGHSGNIGNELADRLANRGLNEIVEGRDE